MFRIRLLPFFDRALELYREQGLIEVETERDAEDFIARTGNRGMRVHVSAGPHALFAYCALGRTQDLPIKPGEGVEEVRALGQIAKAILLQSIRQRIA